MGSDAAAMQSTWAHGCHQIPSCAPMSMLGVLNTDILFELQCAVLYLFFLSKDG